jgi:Trypsin-like peptidase domain
MPNIDLLSLTTVPIQPFSSDRMFPHATSFVWERARRRFLITNWHVVSARNAETGENLCQGARPNMLKAHFNPRSFEFRKEVLDIPIRGSDDEPLWLVHPTHSSKRKDVVAIPLDALDSNQRVGLHAVNQFANANLQIQIGMEVFILGYPFEVTPPAYPVWKRGSIASEPELVRLTGDYYLVDTASRPGMSGAPVVLRSWHNHMVTPGVTAVTDTPLNRFIGIYSGRRSTKVDEAQIGMVWHELVIHEIIVGNKRDE